MVQSNIIISSHLKIYEDFRLFLDIQFFLIIITLVSGKYLPLVSIPRICFDTRYTGKTDEVNFDKSRLISILI